MTQKSINLMGKRFRKTIITCIVMIALVLLFCTSAFAESVATCTGQGWYFEDSNAYVVYVTGISCTSGIDMVMFPTWTDANGQDDLAWYNGYNLGNGVWSYRIYRSNHNNELGTYITDVWVRDSSGQMVNPHVRFYVDCENYNAQVTDNIPRTMEAGKTYTVSVTGRNIGYNTWTNASNYRLGGGLFTGETRYYINDSTSVGLYQSNDFTFNVTAPTTPGTYSGWFRMLQEMVTWFGEQDNLTVNVVDTTPPTQPTISTSGNSSAMTFSIGGSTDSGSGVSAYQYNIDNLGWTSCSNPVTVTNDGQHTVQAKAIDKSGNVSSIATATFTVNLSASMQTASEILQDNPVNQTINNPADMRYYKISKTASDDFLEAKIVDPVVSGQSLQYTVTLYDPNGKLLATQKSTNGQDYVRCKVTSAGDYYIKVNGDSGNYSATVPYTLTVK